LSSKKKTDRETFKERTACLIKSFTIWEKKVSGAERCRGGTSGKRVRKRYECRDNEGRNRKKEVKIIDPGFKNRKTFVQRISCHKNREKQMRFKQNQGA